jgi:hypothetical protein
VSEKNAQEGRQVARDGDDHLWTVAEVYRGIPRPQRWVRDRFKAHERWRKVTDV